MRGKRKIAFMAMATLLVVVCACWIALARQHRAIALQPLDYVKAISSEISRADSGSRGWYMIKVVSHMFWGSYEVRMVDGRAFSCLPLYLPPVKTEEQPLIDDHDLEIVILDANENTGEVQQQN